MDRAQWRRLLRGIVSLSGSLNSKYGDRTANTFNNQCTKKADQDHRSPRLVFLAGWPTYVLEGGGNVIESRARSTAVCARSWPHGNFTNWGRCGDVD